MEQAPQRAREALTRLLKVRARSVYEVETRLKEKQFDAQVIADTVTWALSCGLLDDAAFAQQWVEDRLYHRPTSARFLRLELRRKGLPERVIAPTLSALNLDERELARRVVERHLPAYQSQPVEVQQRKLIGLLQRRGFASEAIRTVLYEHGLMTR